MATIEFIDGRYFIGIWFVGDGKTKDWIAAVFKDAGDTDWQIRYRFRYYKEKDPWGGNDKKNAYKFRSPKPERELELEMDMLAALISSEFGKVAFVPLHSDDCKSNLEKLAAQPWAHMKVMTRDEAKAAGYDIPPEPNPDPKRKPS